MNLTDQSVTSTAVFVPTRLQDAPVAIEPAQPDKPYVPQVGDEVEFECEGETLRAIMFNDGTGLGFVDNTDRSDGYIRRVCYYKQLKFRKISRCADSCNVKNVTEIRTIAKAYFASKPAFTGSYAERQAQWIKFHGLGKGSKVKVVRRHENGEDGYTKSNWGGLKDDKYLGNTFIITDIYSDYIVVDSSYFPYFVLDLA